MACAAAATLLVPIYTTLHYLLPSQVVLHKFKLFKFAFNVKEN